LVSLYWYTIMHGKQNIKYVVGVRMLSVWASFFRIMHRVWRIKLFFLLFITLNCMFQSAFHYDWQHFMLCWKSEMFLNLLTWKSGSQIAAETNIVESYSLAAIAPSYGNEIFLTASAKLRKATISIVMSVRPSVRSQRKTRLPLDGFSWSWYSNIFLKFVEKIQVSLKSQKNKGCFTRRPICIWSYLAQFFLQ
jgi:hypothetical protein